MHQTPTIGWTNITEVRLPVPGGTSATFVTSHGYDCAKTARNDAHHDGRAGRAGRWLRQRHQRASGGCGEGASGGCGEGASGGDREVQRHGPGVPVSSELAVRHLAHRPI